MGRIKPVRFEPPVANPLGREWEREAQILVKKSISPPPAFSIRRLQHLVELNHHEVRHQLYELFRQPVFHLHYGETLEQERERTLARWKAIADAGYFRGTLADRTPEGRARYEAVIESAGMLDHSLDIKMSVHYGLFGASIQLLGSEEQASKWAPKVESCEMLGCFALTELGHGSNARGILTEARYDVASETFHLLTPNDEAQKYWIGGAFQSARWTVAFAQLYVDGKWRGIHPFLVRLRDDNGKVMPGITLADCGHKAGLNGVDNGRIWFNVTIPREQLLARHAQVSPDGKYTTPFRSPDARFGASLSSLTGGRVSIASGGINQAKIGLTIALRYALSRRAFGPPGEPETPLMEYQAHQVRLLAPLATTYVMQFVLNELKKKWHRQELGKQMHVWSSGFKALMTWHMAETLQEAREACGGQGFKSENRIGPIKNEHDIAVTFEGDNKILLQAVTKAMMPEFVAGVKAGGVFKEHFKYINKRHELRNINVDAMDIRSPLFGRKVMQRREAALFARLMRELEIRREKGMSAFDAWNDSAMLVEDAARAHTELILTDEFWRVVDELDKNGDRDIAQVLKICGALYVARRIDVQSVFLRLKIISPEVAERVHKAVPELAAQLRPHALPLVDAFGIPPHLLAPIAFDYVKHNGRARL